MMLALTPPPLTYGWKPNEQVGYDISIDATIESDSVRFFGRSVLTPTTESPGDLGGDSDSDTGTGTGFVVHPGGVIVTCAHVVKGGTKIVARIGLVEHNATVIGMDEDRDLAVLRVAAQGLPYLSLGDSDKVQLAQEVRVIGFPLSDVLGESVKVTRGEVSGISGTREERQLQIDATINPGNSGGPLFDSFGRVVGVASAMLAGEGINEVGLAVPSNAAIGLLAKMNVPISTGADAQEMSATELVARATPSVVFIKVEYGASGIGLDKPMLLRQSGFLSQTSSDPLSGPSLPRASNGGIVADRLGQILDTDVELDLPFMMGSIAAVGIEQLPPDADGKVVTTSPILMQRVERESTGPPGLDYGRRGGYRPPWARGLPGSEDRTKVTLMPGVEKTTLQVGSTNGSSVELTKSYELMIAGPSRDAPPYLSMQGSAILQFDKELGLMQSMAFTGTFSATRDGLSIQLPVKVTYTRVDPAKLAQDQSNARAAISQAIDKARSAAATGQAAASAPANTLSGDIGFGNNSSATVPVNQLPSIGTAPIARGLNKLDPNK